MLEMSNLVTGAALGGLTALSDNHRKAGCTVRNTGRGAGAGWGDPDEDHW